MHLLLIARGYGFAGQTAVINSRPAFFVNKNSQFTPHQATSDFSTTVNFL